jgi:hypothetical protein
MTFTTVNKALIAVVAASFIVGVITGRMGAKPAPAAITKTTETFQVKTALTETVAAKEVDHRDVTTTVVSKPDGTKTTTTVDHSVIQDKTTEKLQDKTSQISNKTSEREVSQPAGANWSLGLSYAPGYAIRGTPYSPSAFTPEIGWRVVDQFWLTASYSISSHSPTIGFRIQF